MTLTMRAVVYSRKDVEGIKMLTVPRPSFNATRDKGSISCRVVCAGINPVDAKALIGDKLPHALSGLGRWAVEGRIAGFDFSGTVLAVPKGCDKFKVGDFVYGTMPPGVGSFSEYVIAPMDQIAEMPPSLTFAEAAALPLVGLTALQSLLHDNNLKQGQHMLLVGASGGVGHVALQVAKQLGARVTAICSGGNADFVRKLGADDVVDYSKGDEDLKTELQKLTENHGQFDLCLDTVTSVEDKDRVYKYAEIVKGRAGAEPMMTGRYVTIGGPTLDWILAGLKRTIGLNLFSHDRMLFWVRFPQSARALDHLRQMCDQGHLRPVLAGEVAFQESSVREAFAKLHQRRVVGKQVLRVSPDP